MSEYVSINIWVGRIFLLFNFIRILHIQIRSDKSNEFVLHLTNAFSNLIFNNVEESFNWTTWNYLGWVFDNWLDKIFGEVFLIINMNKKVSNKKSIPALFVNDLLVLLGLILILMNLCFVNEVAFMRVDSSMSFH